jgi:hypothetical protein
MMRDKTWWQMILPEKKEDGGEMVVLVRKEDVETRQVYGCWYVQLHCPMRSLEIAEFRFNLPNAEGFGITVDDCPSGRPQLAYRAPNGQRVGALKASKGKSRVMKTSKLTIVVAKSKKVGLTYFRLLS